MTAEMAISLLLAASKRLVPADAGLRVGDWRPRGVGPPPITVEGRVPQLMLKGKTVLVLGYGAVGRRVACPLAFALR